ncbi:ArgE/DapE family deacylase [Xylocopilactobacillus apicola]|uniref:Probable succinyl-diaminopimelate desuccinylase n=1 Tax=Xylocopilactobacillus apicola TaxID=2932184 RepID=A0AAU9D8B9_9LACO|nr:ArgE/DapE family deacylase [Xylocopilactobacillus apicola]BDR58580.1 succinyl-diaminopimelate desuccinylase [Xylocopilactobacillus apicola]
MNEQDKLSILSKLVGFKSVNDHEKPVAQYLQELLKKYDIKSEIVEIGPDRANLVAEIGSGKPVLAISGHMDVVDVELANWKTDPFKMSEIDGNLYGRGSTDMKSGLAAMIIAMIELKESKTPINGTIRLLATAGEEVGQAGAEKLFQDGYMKDVDTLLIGEPSGYRAVYANKGELDITIKSKGKAAHSSMPALGNNAVEHLLNILDQIREMMKNKGGNAHNEVLGDTVFNIDIIKGGTQPNAIPGSAEAVLNIRTIPEFDNESILKLIKQEIENYNNSTRGDISMDVEMDIIPIIGDVNCKIIELIKKIAKPYMSNIKYTPEQIKLAEEQSRLTGMPFSTTEIKTMGVSGGTDASKFLFDRPNGFNYVVFGPGENNAHQDNEYVTKQMYFDFIEIYKELFTEFFA